MTRRVYQNPPIEEALCEFSFTPSDWDLAYPVLLRERLRATYPGKARKRDLFETELRDGTAGGSSIGVKQTATLQFPSADNRLVLGVRRDVMSVHMLRPYQGWERFVQQIEEALSAYVSLVEPEGIKRIGIRYINRIEIKGEKPIDLKNFFTASPTVAADFPGKMINFLTRSEFTYDDRPAKLVMTFASAPAPADMFAFLLDFDMIFESQDTLPIGEAMSIVQFLRERERDAFESSITDHTRELFDASQS